VFCFFIQAANFVMVINKIFVFSILTIMKLKDIIEIIDGQVVCGQSRLNEDVEACFASDLMSDVLTLQASNIALITGLMNIQTIRTAEMADINYIILVRKRKYCGSQADSLREQYGCCGVPLFNVQNVRVAL
jgi:hypothetical protein